MQVGVAPEPSRRGESGGSSSINWISGDRPLGLGEKGLYCALNVAHNLVPPGRAGRELGVESFRVPASELSALLEAADSKDGPARALSDCFLRRQDWPSIRSRLGEIHVVDAGCGDGGYARKLFEFAEGALKSYLGFDANEHRNWSALRGPDIDFVKASAEGFSAQIPPDTNFFFSHSALEHFREDLGFLAGIRDFIARSQQPTLQIHVVPAPAGLALYCFHGYRQYPRHALLKIRNLFSETGSDVRVYSLGGYRSVALHFRRITLPVLRGRGSEAGSPNYESELRQVLANDLREPAGPAAYYAIVIESPSPGGSRFPRSPLP
jgi:hypothetical protein